MRKTNISSEKSVELNTSSSKAEKSKAEEINKILLPNMLGSFKSGELIDDIGHLDFGMCTVRPTDEEFSKLTQSIDLNINHVTTVLSTSRGTEIHKLNRNNGGSEIEIHPSNEKNVSVIKSSTKYIQSVLPNVATSSHHDATLSEKQSSEQPGVQSSNDFDWKSRGKILGSPYVTKEDNEHGRHTTTKTADVDIEGDITNPTFRP